jgi:hypothetical protein
MARKYRRFGSHFCWKEPTPKEGEEAPASPIPQSWQSYCGSIIIRYVSKIPSYCTDDAADDDDEERRSFSRFGGPEEKK